MSLKLAELTAAFKATFTNGVAEVGLEVGSDPGLPTSEYIRIPASMALRWHVIVEGVDAWKAALKAWGYEGRDGAKSTKGKGAETSKAYFGRYIPGEIIDEHAELYKANNKLFVRYLVDGSDDPIDLTVESFHQPLPSAEAAADFYVVNDGHIRDAEIMNNRLMWVHAVRYWSVVSGLVYVGDKCGASVEYIEVDTPEKSYDNPAAVEFAEFIYTFQYQSYTALSARAGTWRKTNHCTGGQIATGFARRWLTKEGMYGSATDKADRQRDERLATSAFYVATHASSVHAILAHMSAENPHHWAHLDPKYGLQNSWDVKSSTKLRLAPNTQVAGAAWVSDGKVVLEMMVKEGISPLLNKRHQIGALVAAYNEVLTNGVRCAVYARWFMGNHPDASLRAPIAFDQKNAGTAELIGELACVAKLYYRGSTIAGSAALNSATEQAADAVAEEAWRAIGTARASSTSEQIVAVYTAMKGGATTATIAEVLSADDAVATRAITAYNAESARDAALLGLPAPVVADPKSVMESRKLAGPAQ